MSEIFDYADFRKFLESWIENLGSAGYGMKAKIASALGISSSLVSQILKGEKTFTSDQASDLSDFIGLNELESDYLHLLVEFDRAGSVRYREKLLRKLQSLRLQSRRVGKRVPRQKELTEPQKAIFYSSWIYTGIRNLAAIEGYDDAGSIAKKLNLEPGVVNRVIRYLLENNLCREEKGRLTYGPASTHVDNDSPFVNKHHQNWRFQAIQTMERRRDEDLFFTSPMSLSVDAAALIRKRLPEVIQSIMEIAGPSPSEICGCLNIDWFEY